MRRVLQAAAISMSFFLLHHLAILAAHLQTPVGYEPSPFLRNSDVPQYLSWIELAREYWLLPSFHNAVPTTPAMFQPVPLLIARSGLPIEVAYYGLQIVFQWFAAYAFLVALDQFCKSPRQKRFAILFTLSALPVFLLVYAAAHVLPVQKLLFIPGIIDYAYQSADGLFRGGASNSPTLSWGTATLLLGFTLLAKYLEDPTRQRLTVTAVCFFLSGLLHPFEIFVLTAAATPILLFLRRSRDVTAWVTLSLAGALGVLPYVIQTLRTPWLMEMSKQARWQPPFYLWPLFVFGVPFAFLIYLLFLRFRLRETQDLLLASWFACGIVLPYVPFLRGAEHFYDGYACCIGLLLTRRLAIDPQLHPLYTRFQRRFHFAAGGLAAVTVASLAAMYVQIWNDGANPDPFLISAVRQKKETKLLGWMKQNLDRSLVLSPVGLAPWVAATPLPSFASHDIMTIGFEEQAKLADRFYSGEDIANELFTRYPVRYIVVPESTKPRVPLSARLIHDTDGYRVFALPSSSGTHFRQADQLLTGHVELTPNKSDDAQQVHPHQKSDSRRNRPVEHVVVRDVTHVPAKAGSGQ
jgi:hypothetical protein